MHEVLDALPAKLAEIFGADVCSIYLQEGEGLALRANVGFAPDTLADVRLRAGEGLTGVAVRSMRPISLAAAPTHAAFRLFPELSETRFPVFLAVPIASQRGAVGAIVLQRREGPAFPDADIELAAALSAPLAGIVEQSKLVDEQGAAQPARAKRRNAPRVTLPGRSVVRGKAVGRLMMAARPASDAPPTLGERGRDNALRLLDASRAKIVEVLKRQNEQARGLGLESGILADIGLVLDDGAVRERVLDLCGEGQPLVRALCQVAGEAVRAGSRTQDHYAEGRAMLVSDTCEALALVASGLPRTPRGSTLAAERLTLVDLLVALQAPPAAFVMRTPPDKVGQLFARLVGVPTVADVGGLFRWAAEHDLILVDGDHGLVRVNPRRGEVALVRDLRNRVVRDPAEQAR